MLTRRGELPRDATAAFLRDCFSQLEPLQDCFVWSGWIDAVAWLGLAELKPLAQQVFQRKSIDPEWLTLKDFEEDLQYSVDHPGAEPLHPEANLPCSGRPSRNCPSGSISSRRRRTRIRLNGNRIFPVCPSAIPCATSGATIPVLAAAEKNSRNAA